MVARAKGTARGKRREQSPAPYSGKLGRRRIVSDQTELALVWNEIFRGGDPTLVLANDDRGKLGEDGFRSEGLKLLYQHYGVDEGGPEPLAALFWCLLRAHVPYFMPPVRKKGRPMRLRVLYPMLARMLEDTPEGRFNMTADELFVQFAELVEIQPETVEREFRKWKKIAGEKRS